jgi:hypothetical protein
LPEDEELDVDEDLDLPEDEELEDDEAFEVPEDEELGVPLELPEDEVLDDDAPPTPEELEAEAGDDELDEDVDDDPASLDPVDVPPAPADVVVAPPDPPAPLPLGATPVEPQATRPTASTRELIGRRWDCISDASKTWRAPRRVVTTWSRSGAALQQTCQPPEGRGLAELLHFSSAPVAWPVYKSVQGVNRR